MWGSKVATNWWVRYCMSYNWSRATAFGPCTGKGSRFVVSNDFAFADDDLLLHVCTSHTSPTAHSPHPSTTHTHTHTGYAWSMGKATPKLGHQSGREEEKPSECNQSPWVLHNNSLGHRRGRDKVLNSTKNG